MSPCLYLGPKKGLEFFTEHPLISLEITSLSVISSAGAWALSTHADNGWFWWLSSDIPSHWRGGTSWGLATLRTCLHLQTQPLHMGQRVSMLFLFISMTSSSATGSAMSTPGLSAAAWPLPGCSASALTSLHERSSRIARDKNRCESYRNKANTLACCFLFSTILDLNFMAPKLQRGEDTNTTGLSQPAISRNSGGEDSRGCSTCGREHHFCVELNGEEKMTVWFSMEALALW